MFVGSFVRVFDCVGPNIKLMLVYIIILQSSSSDLEALVTSQSEELIGAIRRRRVELLASVRQQKTRKQQTFSQRLADSTQRLHRTTGLIQFGVEVLKESDPTAFLLVSFSTADRSTCRHAISSRRRHLSALYTMSRK